MPTDRFDRALEGRGWVLAVFCLLAMVSMSQTACTRDDVAAAFATIAVELEATLQPWGATAVANAQSVATQVPSMIATSKASTPSNRPTNNPNQPALKPAAKPTEEAVVASPPPVDTLPASATATQPPTTTFTPVPTATSTSSATPPPSATPEPTATPTPTMTPEPTLTPTPYPQEIQVTGGTMVRIPGGVFHMGATANRLSEECDAFRDGCQSAWFSSSEPVHSVLLRSYYIDIHEVTNGAYLEFLSAQGNACSGQLCLDFEQSRIFQQGDTYSVEESLTQHPATGVTWYGAQAFCEWRGARLPTEAEWEKAAAWDGKAAASRQYPWGNVFDGRSLNSCDASCDEQQANPAFDDGYPTTAPVASFANGRSAYGLYDMAGNVWEWVADWYDAGYYQVSDEANPMGPEDGSEKVVRGGSWFDTGNFTATTIRFPSAPTNADRTIGFRCAADLSR